MLMKLALRNVRRSVRDYAVYFVTLTLGVAVFYAFNAIGDSRVLFEAQEGAANVFLTSGASIFDILVLVMTYFSIVVAVVLGFWSCTPTDSLFERARRNSAHTCCWA